MPSLPKFLTLPVILSTLFPPATPGKATEFPEKWVINGFYALAGWSLLGAPNWQQLSAPSIPLPTTSQSSSFTTSPTRTEVKPVSGILVTCPSAVQVVNIRQGAGLTPILATVPCGDRVNITGGDRVPSSTETWVPIEYKGIKGWSTARYLAL